MPMNEIKVKPARLLLRTFLCGAALAALGTAGWQTFHIHRQYRLEAVTEGVVYKSGTMPPAHLAEVAKRLGLRTVIDLRTDLSGQDSTNTTPLPELEAESAALANLGVRHIRLPTPQVPTAATVERFLEVIRDPANRPTLIHCYHGIGRTELFVAIYRMELEGWSNQKARAATRFFLPGSSFSDTAEKGRFLIGYQAHGVANLSLK